jgi:hypothetical protein
MMAQTRLKDNLYLLAHWSDFVISINTNLAAILGSSILKSDIIWFREVAAYVFDHPISGRRELFGDLFKLCCAIAPL